MSKAVTATMTVNLENVMELPEIQYKRNGSGQLLEIKLPLTESFGVQKEYLLTAREVYFSDNTINIKSEVDGYENESAWLSFIMPFHGSELKEFLRVIEVKNYNQDNLFLHKEDILGKSFRGFLVDSKSLELYKYAVDKRKFIPAETKLHFAMLPDAEVEKIRRVVTTVKALKKDLSEDTFWELLEISGKDKLKLRIYEISDMKKEDLSEKFDGLARAIDFLKDYSEYTDLFTF